MEVVKEKAMEAVEWYDWAHSVSDERVSDWFLMQGYAPTLAIVAVYLLTVWLLPKWMEHREPMKLKVPIIIYNFVCVAINFHICKEVVISSTALGYSYSCQPVNYTYEHYEYRIAKALWWFYFSKCVEMMDTIFFILRKKNNQVSFLHVYHHATMFPIWWIGVKWVAGGQSFFGAMINSAIHVIMYSYYGVAALGPEYQKYLWWKKYLTKIQLAQFCAGIYHASQSAWQGGCGFPMWMNYALMFYATTILMFFLNFYFHAYMKKGKGKSNGVTNGLSANGVEQKKDK